MDKAGSIPVENWIDMLIGNRKVPTAEGSYGGRGNIGGPSGIDITSRATIRVKVYELKRQEKKYGFAQEYTREHIATYYEDVEPGWKVIIYHRYDNQEKGAAIATIFAPTKQITIRFNAKPRVIDLANRR